MALHMNRIFPKTAPPIVLQNYARNSEIKEVQELAFFITMLVDVIL